MKIERMKICGLTEPVGYTYDALDVSWNVVEARGKHEVEVVVSVALSQDFEHLIFQKKGTKLPCEGTALQIQLKPYTRYYVRVAVRTDAGEYAQETTFFETGKMKEPWQAGWIGTQQKDEFHPVFCREFITKKKTKTARMYICGLGLFEAFINGENVTKEVLTPFVSDYDKRMQVLTFDVTDRIRQDKNTVAILLGNGWYKGRFGLGPKFQFGNRFAVIAELHLLYEDGEREMIGTDETWQYRGSDIEDGGIYDGEIVNHMLWEGKENEWKAAVQIELSKNLLKDRYSLPLRVMEEIPVQQVILTPAGETVLDMGQNFAGWIRFYSRMERGARLHMDFGEILQDGNFYNENYRTASGGFTYISGGKEEWVSPHFTYFGFRYVRVTGGNEKLDKDDFVGCVVYSDLERTGWITTDHPKINRLAANALWGQKSNFVDIPTDCPQRDERLGWTADAQIFAATATYHMDTKAFYRKFLRDVRDAQLAHGGGVPAYIPENPDGMCPICAAWGDAVAVIPKMLKSFYNNTEELRLYYPMMREWVEYVAGLVKQHHGKKEGLWDFDFQFGDWLALDGKNEQDMKGGTSDAYVATAYYYQSVKTVAETAAYLGCPEQAESYRQLADGIRETLLWEFFSPAGHLTENTQTAHILALRFGIYRDREILIQDFLSLLEKSDYKIKCGFTGAPVLCQTLCEIGHSELAWKFILNEEAPGWLHEVNLGATTIWERWNSLLPDGKISGTDMNSMNHYSYGNVVEFLYAYAAGIRPGTDGFLHAVIAPQPVSQGEGSLRELTCIYQSPVGRYVCEWHLIGEAEIEIHIEVPFGCEAQIVLPDSGRQPFAAESGRYDFRYERVRRA